MIKIMETNYNGWTNKATWLVKSYAHFDEPMRNKVAELLKNAEGADAAQALESYIREFCESKSARAAIFSFDLLNFAIDSVNYTELVKYYKTGNRQ